MEKDLSEIIRECLESSEKKLDLSGKNLTFIPGEIRKLEYLEELNLSNNELAGLPSEIENLLELRVLNLGDNNFREFPLQIMSLVNLEELSFENNHLSTLPPEIVKLQNLKYLNLRNNKFNKFPLQLWEFKSLEVLSFTNNDISDFFLETGKAVRLKKLELDKNNLFEIPQELLTVSSLEELNLSYNHLSSLPAGRCNLKNLRVLKLNNNQLEDFNPDVENLGSLRELNLSCNKLTALSPEICNLSQLRLLELENNTLKNIPEEIGNLKNLEELNLKENQLYELPPETGKLKKLLVLELGSNCLESLPVEIKDLFSLQELDARSNRLKTLPSEIGLLGNLQILELRDNQIDILPPEIAFLKLHILNLENNNLKIPPEIVKNINKPVQIINYYLKHQYTTEEKIALHEAKMLVVGQGGVGKTSLVNRLISDFYSPHETMTKGINIKRWYIQTKELGIRLNIWDFGGQEIMHATHQFFLTKRSLYILVLDSRQGEHESRIEYWLKIIQSFGEDSPIIVVCNKCDQEEIDLDWKGLKSKYPAIKKFIKRFSCSTGEGLEEVKEAIQREVYKLDHIHDELLRSWFEVKKELEEMKSDYISYDDYTKMCEEKNINDDISRRTLIDFLHDLGIILHFHDHPILEETSILNPEWVTGGVYQIVNSCILFENKGILHRNDLDKILEPKEYPRNKHMFIINMMRKFELCFDFPEFPDTKFLLPDLLGKEEPDTGKWVKPLSFQIHYDVLPGSVMSRFTVRMHEYILNQSYWRNGVLLVSEDKKNEALVKADSEEKKIFIYIRGEAYSRRTFLQLIRSNFRIIHASIPGIKAKEKVSLSGYNDFVVDYEHLLVLEEMGETFFIPEGFRRKVSVKSLLDGIEIPEQFGDKKYLSPRSKEKFSYSKDEKEDVGKILYQKVMVFFIFTFIFTLFFVTIMIFMTDINYIILIFLGIIFYLLLILFSFFFMGKLKEKDIFEIIAEFFGSFIFKH